MMRPRAVLALIAVLALAVLTLAVRQRETAGLYPTTFDDTPIQLEVVTSDAAKERGLGGHANIPDDYGMLFVFTRDERWGIWMKDMRFALDLFWLDASGTVLDLAEGVGPETYPEIFYPALPARYVLETKAGFAASHGLSEGSDLALPSSSPVSK